MKNISEQCIKIGNVDEEGLLELSISKAKTWRRCQYKYAKKYIDKLRPKAKAKPLTVGTWVHACLESRDKGENWIELLKKMKAEEYDKLFEEERAMLGNIPNEVFVLMRGYHQTYIQLDVLWETIRVEQDFMIRIPGTKIVVTGKIDKIARFKETGKIWCWEHKTMKKSPPTETFRFTDIQTGLYLWVMVQLAKYLGYNKEDVGGVIFDYIRTKPPTEPRLLKNGTMSKAKLDCDPYTYLAALKKEGLDPNDYTDFVESLKENVFFVRKMMYKSQAMTKNVLNDFLNTGQQIVSHTNLKKQFTRSVEWTCDRPKCEYRDLCIADLEGLDTTLIIQQQFNREGDDSNGEEPEDESD